MNEIFIRLIREKNNNNHKRKRDKIKIFVWLLIENKKINDSNMIYNYCSVYYKVCKNVIKEAIKELKEKALIISMANLGDNRKTLLFNSNSLTHF